MNTKIAILTRDGKVGDHIRHCKYYTIFSVSFGIIKKEEKFHLPEDCMNDANIALMLSQKGVKVILIGNIWNDELEILTFHGIEVFYNCSGNVKDLISAYLNGELSNHEWKNKEISQTFKN